MQEGGVFRKRLKLVLLAYLLLICGAGGAKFKGVSVRNGRYYCSVRVPGKNYVLWVGTYETELEAARAYDVAAHYVGKNRREFNFNDYHPSLESVLAPFPSHLSLNIANKGAVTKFIARQADGLLQDRRRLLRSDDVHVNVQHLQGVQMDQTPAHDESLVDFPHLDWSQVSPGHADLNHVLVPEHDFPSRELDLDVDDQTLLEEFFSSEVEKLCFVQQSCQADDIVTENEGGFGGQLGGVEQPGLQAAIDLSWSLLPHTQMQPLVDDFAGSDQFLLSEPEDNAMDVGNQNLVGQDLMMLDPCDDTTIPTSQEYNDRTMDDLPMATDTSCPRCASKKIATHLLSYQLHDPVGLLKTMVALFQGLKEAHMLDSTSDEGCEFPLCTTHQEETHGGGDESVREQANLTRGIALPSSNDDPLSGLTQNIFMYVSSTRIHPVLLFKFILVMLSVLPYLLVRLSYKKEFEGRGDMVVAPSLPTQIGCSYRPNQYLPWQGPSSTTPGMHPRDQWQYIINRSSSARGEIRRNIEAREILVLVEALKNGPTAKDQEAAVNALINLSEVKELMGRFEEAKVIPSLLAILRDDTENWFIRSSSIFILFSLCKNNSMEKVIVDFGGVPSVIHLLRDESIHLSWETMEMAFLMLAIFIEISYATIKKSSTMLDIAIPLVINKLQQCASGVNRGVTMCIVALAQVPEYSCIFGSYGAIPILFETLKDRMELTLKTDAMYALLILFDANKNKFNPCTAIPILVNELWELEDHEMHQELAEAILHNLLTEMEDNFVDLEKSGAVPALVNLLHDGPPLSKIFAANTLIDICGKQEHVTDIVRSGALIPPLVTILQEGDTQQKEGAALCLFRLNMLVECHQVIYAMVDHAVDPLLDIIRKDFASLVTAIAASILKLILPSEHIMSHNTLSSIILNIVLRAMNDGNMVEKERVVIKFLLRLIRAELNCDKKIIEEWTPIIAHLVNMPLDENTLEGNSKEIAAAIFIALSIQVPYRAFAVNCGAIRSLKWLLQTGNSGEKAVAAAGLSFLFSYGEGMDEFVRSDGITYMIDIIRKEVPSTKSSALNAIFYLSEVDAYKVVIRQWSSFFLSLFNTLIRDGAGDLIERVSYIVVNIFEGDKGTEDFEHSDAFPIVLHELQYGAPSMREIAAACLLRFTRIHELKASFGRSDVIPSLVNILRTGGSKEKVNSAKILVMLILEDVKFQISIATSGALPLFVDLLKSAETPAKIVASMFLHIFLVLGNGKIFFEGPKSNIAFEIGDLPGHAPASMEQFIRSEIEDIETNHSVISALVNMLGDENCELQQFAALCLSELARINEYKLFIGDSYAIPPLVDLLWNGPSNSSETKIAAAKVLFRLSDLYLNRDRLTMFGAIPALINLMVTGNVEEKITVVRILFYFFTFKDTCWNEIIKVTLTNSIDAKNVLLDIIQNGDLGEEDKKFAEALVNFIYIVGENNATTPTLTPPTVEVHEPGRGCYRSCLTS